MAGHTASLNVDGILVTMPHKFTAFTQCTTSSERAKMLQGVSVVRPNPDGTWHGDMLEDLAFVNAEKEHGAQPEGARVLLIRAGAAGSAIAIELSRPESANLSSTTPTSRGSLHFSICSPTSVEGG